PRTDGEKAGRYQQAPDVGRGDRTVVRVAEVVHGEPDRKGERKRNAGEAPRSQEFSPHGLPEGNWQCHQQFDRAALALLGPHAHRNRGDQEQLQPGMKIEERGKVRLATLVEAAKVKGEDTRQQQENDDEDVRDRRGKVTRQLAPEYRTDISHQAPCVTARNTSSSRPDSRCSSLIDHCSRRASSLRSGRMGWPDFGSAVRRSSFSRASTAATCGKEAMTSRARASKLASAKPSVTAL